MIELMRTPTEEELRRHQVFVEQDTSFQRKARLLQALWRERRGYPIGRAGTRGELGSRLAMPMARDQLWNFLTPGTRQVVRTEVMDPDKSRNKVYQAPRIYDNLLSSQPLCFNLFAELSLDLRWATDVFRRLLGDRVAAVRAIEFEHSPGRGSALYTADNSAFDVYVEYEAAAGGRGFVGVEVKYHESMNDSPATHRPRYEEVARAMNCFRSDDWTLLRKKPLNQIWRDHLLAGSLRMAHPEYVEGTFAFMFPAENEHAAAAVARYVDALSDASSFTAWTLEQVVDVLEASSRAPWLAELRERYLGVPNP